MSSTDTIWIHPSLSLIFLSGDISDVVNQSRSEKIDPDTAYHFYSDSIRRNPKNLMLHTHRVFFTMQHKDASLLASSLYDLFYLVKKDAGKKLRNQDAKSREIQPHKGNIKGRLGVAMDKLKDKIFSE